jgi:translation elongation factor EF-Tu-like GTPase
MIFSYEDIFEIRGRGVAVIVRSPDLKESDLVVGQTHTFWKMGQTEAFDATIISVEKTRRCLCWDSHEPSYGVLVRRDQVPESVYPRRP